MSAFVLMFALVALLAFALPNEYQSHMKILVKNARLDPIVSLDQQTQGVLYVDDVSEERINTEIELLTSSDVLRRVVEQCHLDKLVKPGSLKPEARTEMALLALQKDLKVTAIRKSSIIEVSYQSPDPVRSAAVVRSLSDLYLRANLKLHGSPQSQAFFEEIAQTYRTQLEEAEAQLAQFRKTHNIVALPEEKSLALQQSSELSKALATSVAGTQSSGRQAEQLSRVLDQTPVDVETEHRSLPNQTALEQLAVLLIGLKNKRAEAVQRYRPDDRIVQELDAQIQQTTDAFVLARDSKSQEVTTARNPSRMNAENAQIRASADYAGERAQAEELARELKSNRARLLALDAATVPYEELTRRVTQLEELAVLYKKKGDEARVNDLLDQQRISNVSIAEQPTQAGVPSSPKRGLILALGFLWSLLVAGITAFVADLLTARISSPYELQQLPELPLLAALPAFAAAPDFGGAFPAVYASMARRDNLVRSQA